MRSNTRVVLGRIAAIVVASLVGLSSAARAEVTYTETDDNLAVVRLTVTPAAEPTPAFKHRFAARDIDLVPGNAVPFYARAITELARTESRVRAKYGDEFDGWYSTGPDEPTLAELPLDKVRAASQEFDWLIDVHLSVATARRDCDWGLGIEEVRGPELISFQLPELQESRGLARALILRIRLALAEKRYDDAIAAMRMNYRLGRDVSQPPNLVCGLVGIAIASQTNGTMLELMAAPESPNLYWALAELPQPLIDLRGAVRVEIDFGPRLFPFIHHAESTDRSPEEWNRQFAQVAVADLSTVGDFGVAGLNDRGAGLAATGLALLGYTHAKQQLIAQGMDAAQVEQMAVGQVIAVYTERNYLQFANEFEKLWYVPFWEMRDRQRAVDRRLSRADPFHGGEDREVLPIVQVLIPAMQAVRGAQVRLERDVAALCVIEALRMYAAGHAGGLPATLDEIREVPVPHNPATGQPFVYRLDGRTAILELPKSDGIPGYYRRFEIKIVSTE